MSQVTPSDMATTIMLRNDMLSGKPSSEDIWEKLEDYYRDEHFVSVAPFGGDEKVIFASTNAGSNRLRLIVNGNGEQTVVTALLDNLGKGASGAAVQNMNIMGNDSSAKASRLPSEDLT